MVLVYGVSAVSIKLGCCYIAVQVKVGRRSPAVLGNDGAMFRAPFDGICALGIIGITGSGENCAGHEAHALFPCGIVSSGNAGYTHAIVAYSRYGTGNVSTVPRVTFIIPIILRRAY